MRDCMSGSGNAHPAACNLGCYHGTGETVPFVNRLFYWAVVFVRFEYLSFAIVPI